MREAAAVAGLRSFRPLTRAEFERIRLLARETFGLDLRSGKEDLVSARLGRHLRESRFGTFDEYCRHVLEDRTGAALGAMIDALTTNFTSFFREPAHFDFLRRSVFPSATGPLRIWSAACATGEEPYSIAMCALDHLGLPALDRVRIIATDISTRALETGRTAVYPADRCDAVPPPLARRCLARDGEGCLHVREELRRMVEFRRLNLIEPFRHLGAFPLIFCRNVMIYFDRATRENLVRRLADCLEPGGWLLVGHAESLSGIDHPLEYVRPAVYRKPGRASAPPRGKRSA